MGGRTDQLGIIPTQPSLAGVGARAELGNNNIVLLQNSLLEMPEWHNMQSLSRNYRKQLEIYFCIQMQASDFGKHLEAFFPH